MWRITLPPVGKEGQFRKAAGEPCSGAGGAKVGSMRWGLVPGWADSAASRLSTFNARIESAATKPTFRQVLGRRHCLVPASGYYEWVGRWRAKQPWYIRPANDPLMFFAGLWDRWQSPAGKNC
jgi:putative SOS response-associated peptidase YedK